MAHNQYQQHLVQHQLTQHHRVQDQPSYTHVHINVQQRHIMKEQVVLQIHKLVHTQIAHTHQAINLHSQQEEQRHGQEHHITHVQEQVVLQTEQTVMQQ